MVRGVMERKRRPELFAAAFAMREGAPFVALRRAFDLAGVAGRVVRARNGVMVVLHERRDGEDARALAEAWRARLAAVAGEVVSAGVSSPRRSAHLAVLHAEQSLVLGRALRGEGRTMAFDDLGPYCFVLGQPLADVRDFCARVLGPLAAAEGRHEDLVRTLEAYLKHHGSVNAVARVLFLHRNTVRQRLRRIAEVTGADLNDADSRLSLHLALLGKQALSHFAKAT